MARCSSCNKFVGVAQGEDFEFDPEVECEKPTGPDGRDVLVTVTGEVRLVLTCADCGDDLMATTQDAELEATLRHTADCPMTEDPGCAAFVSSTDRFEGKGRRAKHFYGADISVTLTCPECKATAEAKTDVEEQASYFNQL